MGFLRSLTPMIGVAASLAAVTALPGCGLILDFDPWPPAPSDAGDVVDGGGIDAAMDGGPDGMRDAFIPDAPADATADAETDAWMSDAASDADAGSDDAGTDAGPPEGCTDGTVEQTYRGTTDMVGCDGALDQCTAHMLCDAGWHLCSWDDYRARGGADELAGVGRWLASCVRNSCSSVTAMAPTNDACGVCGSATTATLTLQFTCPGDGPTEEVACNVGVAADNALRRIGLTSVPCTMARTARTDMTLGATCCR